MCVSLGTVAEQTILGRGCSHTFIRMNWNWVILGDLEGLVLRKQDFTGMLRVVGMVVFFCEELTINKLYNT